MFAEFQKRRGYDLKPLLPALAGNFGPQTDQIRYDFGQTVTELFNDNFNAKFKALTNKYGSRFRIQGYGGPPAALESYAYSDLPEGEGGGNANWRSFRATRYASSASHLINQTMSSSETFTWLHEVPFRATPMDIKAEVGFPLPRWRQPDRLPRLALHPQRPALSRLELLCGRRL